MGECYPFIIEKRSVTAHSLLCGGGKYSDPFKFPNGRDDGLCRFVGLCDLGRTAGRGGRYAQG